MATVFISYRHGDPTSRIADKLNQALQVASDGLGFDLFMDANAIEPADLFDQVILDGLKRTTHFIVLLDNAYWTSQYCRKELAHAINRFENKEDIRLLFVMAGPINPDHLVLDKDRTSGRIVSNDPLIKRISDVQFLGPFSEARRLERLKYESPAELDDQIAQLVERLERVLPKKKA
jgi:hypothetical protein